MSKEINGILLSAGLGTRLRPYTLTTPKPAIPFLGVPLAVYPLSLFESFKIDHLVVNIHHLPEKIKDLFHGLNWPAKELIFSDETKNILGSGGGIRNAISHLIGHDIFFVANADEVILPYHHQIMKDALDFHSFHKGIATILVMKHPEVGTKFGGVWVKDNNKVEKVSKTKVDGCTGYHYIGVMLLSDRIKNYFFTENDKEENIFYDTLAAAMNAGEEVFVHEIETQWFETGNPEDFKTAEKICQTALAQQAADPWVEYLKQILTLNKKYSQVIF